MSALLIWLLLFPAVGGLCVRFHCRAAEGILLTCLLLTLGGVLLCLVGGGALLGLLPWAAALLGGAVLLRAGRAGRRKGVFPTLLGEVLPFVLLAGFFWWLCRGCQFTDWDDFSHWGKAVKWLYTTGTLTTAPGSTDAFASYPPATAVWQAMLLRALPFGFREDIALYANALLTAGWLLLPLRAAAEAKRTAALLLFEAALTPMLVYPSYFYRASVDGLLGVFGAGLLLSAFLPGRSPASAWIEALGCAVLTLTKSSGAGLAATLALVLALCPPPDAGAKAAPAHRPPRREKILRRFRPLLAVGAAGGGWSLYLTFAGVGQRWNSTASPRTVVSLLAGADAGYRPVLLDEFFSVLFFRPNYGPFGLPFAVWPAAFLLLIGCAALVQRGGASRLALGRMTLAGWGVGGVFVLGLLYSYLFVFDPSEATSLASVYRYLDTVTVMLLLVGTEALGVAACRAPAGRRRWGAALPLSVWAVLLPFVPTLQEIRWAPTHAAQTEQARYLARHAAARIDALGVENPRLWLITANDAGAAALQINYELLPQHLPDQANILMADVPPGNPWAREISADAFSRELAQSYDYLYIYCPEDQFVRDYLSLFEDESQVVVDRMFRVVTDADGNGRLRCLDG